MFPFLLANLTLLGFTPGALNSKCSVSSLGFCYLSNVKSDVKVKVLFAFHPSQQGYNMPVAH